jgi:hypothetical protein
MGIHRFEEKGIVYNLIVAVDSKAEAEKKKKELIKNNYSVRVKDVHGTYYVYMGNPGNWVDPNTGKFASRKQIAEKLWRK